MEQKTTKTTVKIVCIFLCVFLMAISGCSSIQKQDQNPNNEQKTPSDELKRLLPEKAGFKWIYNGFVEYGHNMVLDAVIPRDTSIHYQITGNIDDPSGGEANVDLSLKVEYEVTSNSLIMRKTSEKMMDNFPEIELIRLPLTEGTQWKQQCTHNNGKEYQLDCTIQEVETQNDGKIYTVLYKDKDSDFYEKRRIQENWGVISFETVWESREGPVIIGYYLYKEASGYPEKTALNAFLPPLEKQLRFFGLAEYAHEGELVKVKEGREEDIYQFNGTFRDGSGIPGQFKVQYQFNYSDGTVQEKVLENTRSEKNEVNSKIHHPVILKLPLEVGNTWQQQITFKGEKKMMSAAIVSIAYEGSTFYSQMKSGHPVTTVRYMVEDVPGYFQNMYIEERRFKPGLGMIGFSRLMEGNLDIKDISDQYQVEQTIINNMFGYSLATE